eukprot:m.54389 g.54389  ORF g.54389 m.54389 type:complete len:329 (+) comp15509_c0_seq1:330-1316(+)
MNKVREIERINDAEIASAASGGRSWHDDYNNSAYIFIGGLDYELTEGDIISVFSQYGEPVDINLKRDKSTGKSLGYCFLAYENQKSTRLAIDNFNGSKLCGRTINVDHVKEYKPPESDEENEDDAVAAQNADPRYKVGAIAPGGAAAVTINADGSIQKLPGSDDESTLANSTSEQVHAELKKKLRKAEKKAKKEKKRLKKEKRKSKKGANRKDEKEKATRYGHYADGGYASSDSDSDGGSSPDGSVDKSEKVKARASIEKSTRDSNRHSGSNERDPRSRDYDRRRDDRVRDHRSREYNRRSEDRERDRRSRDDRHRSRSRSPSRASQR